MKKVIDVLKKTSLFKGISENDIEAALICLNFHIRVYQKGSFVFLAGDSVSTVGIVISGSIQVFNEDFLGNKSIMTEVQSGGMFAEAFACAHIDRIPVTVQATSDSEIIFIDYKKIISTCSSACEHHRQLVENMLVILAKKNMVLSRKIEHISKRSIRDKILSYLSFYADKSNSNQFEIPFNRQEMADYLCVDRSALSAELSKLKNESMIDYNKNSFVIKVKL